MIIDLLIYRAYSSLFIYQTIWLYYGYMHAVLDKILTEVGSGERLMVCGAFNGHVGEAI